jgi:hypothetical protein
LRRTDLRRLPSHSISPCLGDDQELFLGMLVRRMRARAGSSTAMPVHIPLS